MAERLTVTIEDAQLIFKNFSGKEGPFNREGNREFSVVLTEEVAHQMLEDGWNVKIPEPREEGDDPRPYISVAVSYKIRPPKIVMITSSARTNLDEDSVGTLDWADITKADLIINASAWTFGDKSGIKAYLKSLYVTIEEDELERKYAPKPVAS